MGHEKSVLSWLFQVAIFNKPGSILSVVTLQPVFGRKVTRVIEPQHLPFMLTLKSCHVTMPCSYHAGIYVTSFVINIPYLCPFACNVPTLICAI